MASSRALAALPDVCIRFNSLSNALASILTRSITALSETAAAAARALVAYNCSILAARLFVSADSSHLRMVLRSAIDSPFGKTREIRLDALLEH